jgi:hypothetical protein
MRSLPLPLPRSRSPSPSLPLPLSIAPPAARLRDSVPPLLRRSNRHHKNKNKNNKAIN